MEAQTAWLQAQSQQIDAEIDVRLSQTDLQKALGTLDIKLMCTQTDKENGCKRGRHLCSFRDKCHLSQG